VVKPFNIKKTSIRTVDEVIHDQTEQGLVLLPPMELVPEEVKFEPTIMDRIKSFFKPKVEAKVFKYIPEYQFEVER
jgi:hypothetical protein